MRRGLDDGIPRIAPERFFRFDLLDQDHRIARNHTRQREHPEECDEAEGFVGEQQRRDVPRLGRAALRSTPATDD